MAGASPWARGLIGAALMLSPLALNTAVLAVSITRDWPPAAHWTAYAVCLGVGVAGLWILPARRWIRALVSAAYVPVMAWALILWSLLFACGFAGQCV